MIVDDDVEQVIYRIVALDGGDYGDIALLEAWLRRNGLTKDEVGVIKEGLQILKNNIEWQDCATRLKNIVQGSYSAGSNDLDLLRDLFVVECL